MYKENIAIDLNTICRLVHESNKKWWICLDCQGRGVIEKQFNGKETPYERCIKCNQTGQLKRNIGELLMLTVSELSEAMEGHRKNLMDDKLPHRKMFEVELADAIIRIFDIAGGLGLDLGGAFVEKMAFNAVRKDHTLKARMGENGKKY